MKLKQYFFIAVALVSAAFLQSCSDDKDTSAKAVLSSVSLLNYEGLSPESQTITVVSDANWFSEAPEWINVSPATGQAGQTEVTLTVGPNLRDGALDNPRRGTVIFRGNSLASICEVSVRQDGDKYRDVGSYTINDLYSMADETVVEIKNISVATVGTKGFIATDGKDNLLVMNSKSETITAGDVVSIQGERQHDSANMPYITLDNITSRTSGTVPVVTYQDITDEVDTYRSTSRTAVTITGFYDAGYLNIEGQDYRVAIDDAPSTFNASSLNAHDVVLNGYYCGTLAPIVHIIVDSFEDLGQREVIYFFDDFEWLEEWSIAANAGRSVEDDNLDANSPGIRSASCTATIDGQSINLFDYTEQVKGYKFLYDKDDNQRIYLNRNYFKFGKTGNHAGITLPKIDIEAGTKVVLQFDWCPMRQGSGKIDPVTLFVEVTEDGKEPVKIDVPEAGWENGHRLEWIRAEVDLSAYKIDKYATITISQNEFDLTTANRWFLDNVKIKSAN